MSGRTAKFQVIFFKTTRLPPKAGSHCSKWASVRRNTASTKSAERPLFAWDSVLRAGGVTPNPATARRLSRSQPQTSLRMKACAKCTKTNAAGWLQIGKVRVFPSTLESQPQINSGSPPRHPSYRLRHPFLSLSCGMPVRNGIDHIHCQEASFCDDFIGTQADCGGSKCALATFLRMA